MIKTGFLNFQEQLSKVLLITFLVIGFVLFPDHAGSSITSPHQLTQTEITFQINSSFKKTIYYQQAVVHSRLISKFNNPEYLELITNHYNRLINIKLRQISWLFQLENTIDTFLPFLIFPQNSPEDHIFQF